MDTLNNLLGVVPTFVWWTFGAVIAAALALAGMRALKRSAAGISAPDALTWVAASIATAVSAQGMWQFIERTIHLHWSLRALGFAFLEVAVVTSAVRARRSMRDNYSAGVDGIAVWAITSLSALLSALEAASLPEALFRLVAPLVAAWLWERGMSIERRRLSGKKRINWRLTPERILVRLCLAEAQDRTASEVDAQRRLTRVALAADKVAELEPGTRKHRKALGKLKKHGRHMVEHTAVSQDDTQQAYLLAQIGVARSISRLTEAAPAPFWAAESPDGKHTEPSIASTPSVDIESIALNATPTTAHATGVSDEKHTRALLASTPASTPFVSGEDADDEMSEASSETGDAGRDRPDEQDNRIAERWIRDCIRSGRLPTYGEVAEKYSFSRTWARSRVQMTRDRMAAKGYRFLPGNVVVPPADQNTVNGVESAHADDVPMTAVGVQ